MLKAPYRETATLGYRTGYARHCFFAGLMTLILAPPGFLSTTLTFPLRHSAPSPSRSTRQHLTQLEKQSFPRMGLWEEGVPGFQQAIREDRIIRVAGHIVVGSVQVSTRPVQKEVFRMPMGGRTSPSAFYPGGSQGFAFAYGYRINGSVS